MRRGLKLINAVNIIVRQSRACAGLPRRYALNTMRCGAQLLLRTFISPHLPPSPSRGEGRVRVVPRIKGSNIHFHHKRSQFISLNTGNNSLNDFLKASNLCD